MGTDLTQIIADRRRFRVATRVLLEYGPDILESWRRAAAFVDKILRGAKPADLPVEQPTDIPLTVNLKAARDLGLTLSPSVLLRANKVIE